MSLISIAQSHSLRIGAFLCLCLFSLALLQPSAPALSQDSAQGDLSWALKFQSFPQVPEDKQIEAAAEIFERLRAIPSSEPAQLKPLYDELISKCPGTSEAKRAMIATVNLYQDALQMAPTSPHTDIEKIRIQRSSMEGIARVAALYLSMYPASPGNSMPLERERLMQEWLLSSLVTLDRLQEAADQLSAYLNVDDDRLSFRDLLLSLDLARLQLALGQRLPARETMTRILGILEMREANPANRSLQQEVGGLRDETDLLAMLNPGEKGARLNKLIQAREKGLPQPDGGATAAAQAKGAMPALLHPADLAPDLLWMRRELTRSMTGK